MKADVKVRKRVLEVVATWNAEDDGPGFVGLFDRRIKIKSSQRRLHRRLMTPKLGRIGTHTGLKSHLGECITTGQINGEQGIILALDSQQAL